MTKNLVEGWYTVKPIDKERYQERDGLEGPFQTRAGKVVYYDPREGAYYDPDTDMYLSYEEWRELNENRVYTVEYTSLSGKRIPVAHKTFEIFSEAVEFGKAGIAGGNYKSFDVYEEVELDEVVAKSNLNKNKTTKQTQDSAKLHGSKFGELTWGDGSVDYLIKTPTGWKFIGGYDNLGTLIKGKMDIAGPDEVKYISPIDKNEVPVKLLKNVKEEVELAEAGMRPGPDFSLASKEYKGYVLGGEDDSDEDRRATNWGVYQASGDGTYRFVSSVKDPKYNGKYPVSSFGSGVPAEAFKWTVDTYLDTNQAVGEGKKPKPGHNARAMAKAQDVVRKSIEKSQEKDEVKEDDEKQLFMDPDDKMWNVDYDYGPHQSNTIKVKAKSQSHAWEVAKEVAKKKYGHARITSGSVTQVKEVDESITGMKKAVVAMIKRGATKAQVKQRYPQLQDSDIDGFFKLNKVDESDIVNFSSYAGMYSDGAHAYFTGRDGKVNKVSATGDTPRKYYINGVGTSWEDVKRIVGNQRIQPLQGMMHENNSKVTEAAYDRDMDHNKPVVVSGVKGMKSTPFRKKFKNMAAYDRWSDSEAAGNYEVHHVVNEDISQDAHHMERDHEVQMARSDLYKTANYAIKLHAILKGISEEQGLEGWMQAKITKAADYLGSVFHALEYDQMERAAPEMPTMESVEPVSEANMKLARDTFIIPQPGAEQFAKHYRAGMMGQYRAGGPTEKDDANSEKFHTLYSSEETRSGFAGSGTTVYTNNRTGETFVVDRNPNGKGFHGTDHYITVGSSDVSEAVAKIACVKCDEVSTAKAWEKNNGFCPKCKTSSQGVAESTINETTTAGGIAAVVMPMGKMIKRKKK